MYVDKLLEFCSTPQAFTASAASENVVDTQVLRDLGIGEPLFIVVQVAVALGATHTQTWTLEGDADNSWGGTTIYTIGQFAGSAAVGTKLVSIMPPGATYFRYLRLYNTHSSSSTGSFYAFITDFAGVQYIYASGFSVA